MSSGSHLSKELYELIKSIGESKSKQEEDKIITQELSTLKTKMAEPRVADKKMKEYLIRAIYIEMLGHDASFAHIHAINLTQSSNAMAKRIGYLTCGLCLSPESQVLILLIAALQRDLSSSNTLDISAALSAISKLANIGMMNAISEPVTRLMSHTSDNIRKKAVMVLHKFILLSPSSLSEFNEHFRKALCDKDPAVMGASLNFFLSVLQEEKNRVFFKDLIPSFVVILKQIIDHKLPRDHDYHRMPAPWFQIKLLEILALLGKDDQRASEQMYEILGDVMRRADDTGINAGYAIVYQCLKTITAIYPNSSLLEGAAHCISRFVSSDNHNLKYTGITGLISIVQINPRYVAQHQMIVVECLEDHDDTLRRNTLQLLFRMTNPHNVRAIVDKLKAFLGSTSFDSHLKAELVAKITELAEKFAPDSMWYIQTINSVFALAGEHIKPEIVNNLVRLIDEWRDDPESIAFATKEYLRLLEESDMVSDQLMQTAAWVLGEFGDSLSSEIQAQVMTLLCKALHWRFESPTTKGWVLTALLKLGKGVPSDEVRELVSKFSFSRNEDLQQRCYEFAGICTKLNRPLNIKENLGMTFDYKLGFLDGFVQEQISQGAKMYNPEQNKRGLRYIAGKDTETKASEALKNMNIGPYDAPRVDRRPVHINSGPEPMHAAPSMGDGSELRVKQKLWTKQGYVGNLPNQEERRPNPPPPARDPPPPQNTEWKYQPKAVPIQRSQKDIEKEQFAKSVFGGLLGEAPPQGNQPPQRTGNQPPRNQTNNNLLDF